MSKFEVKDDANKVTITLDGNTGDISVGGNQQVGGVIVKSNLDKEIMRLGHTGGFPPGSPVGGGAIYLKDAEGQETIRLSAATGDILAGGNGQDGDLVLFDSNRTEIVRLDASTSSITLKVGDRARIVLAGFTPGGQLGGGGTITVSNLFGVETIHLSADEGSLALRNTFGKNTIYLDGAKADLYLGGANQDGSLTLRNDAGQNTIYLDGAKADLFLGGANQDGRVVVRNAAGKDTVTLDGKAGDISLANEDCAEDFDVSQSADVEPGTVVVIDQDGQLQPSRDPYDKKVAGVISGAGNCRPGLVLGKKSWHPDRLPVALVGTVYCKVDAQYSAIEIGDLLTTSPTPGHAMKAGDPLKAFGAVIGKALRALKAGQDLIPILVALQ